MKAVEDETPEQTPEDTPPGLPAAEDPEDPDLTAVPPTLGLAHEGGGKRNHFITFEEIQASEGEANFDEKQDRKSRPGVVITTKQGSVVGWLMLRLRVVESQLYSQAGLLAAAGTEIQRLRERYEPEADQPPAETPSGLLVPPGAKSGLVVPR